MNVSSRTPEGNGACCPVCGHAVCVEPSQPTGDVPCPCCGTLLWCSGGSPRSEAAGVPVQTAWEYALQRLQDGDVAAGLAILQNVVTRKPNHVAPRRTLREIERKLRAAQDDVASPHQLLMMEVWAEIRQAKHKRSGELVDWDAIDRAAERGLAADPWDVDLHLELAEACRARRCCEAARFAYECALECAPWRTDIRQRLSELP